ncbi:MAG: OFA family MFS transporter [Gammaproteobacteria bacterium]
MADILAKQRTIAKPGFNRWLVPPAALAIHLCIGMAYGFSVFWLPLSKSIGITESVACSPDLSLFAQIIARNCDWKISTLGWMYTLFFVYLGSSAAIFGHWLEHAGPRKAGAVAALCWAGGLLISAWGVYVHEIRLLWLGSGIIGGCGLGLGYISPVTTLIKWFPDRRGMATGMAIMGFGGGAMIGSPLADMLMKHYQTESSVGVWETFVTLGAVYFIAMMCGAFGYRVPPPDWKPAHWTPPAQQQAMITSGHVHLYKAPNPVQFWLLWGVLCMNVSAGIGVIGMASPMLQEVFGGKLIDVAATLAELTQEQAGLVAAIAAGFTGLLSLFNLAGRIFWASLSDFIGRKRTYFTFFILGMILYASAPYAGKIGSSALFVGLFCIILTMYGGGFATIPAYLADMFGTQFVGAIHGRLLTAWSMAGILGPVIVNYIREFQIDHGVPPAEAYNTTMYVLAGLLFVGFLCNLALRPVADRFYMTDREIGSRTSIGPRNGLRIEMTGGDRIMQSSNGNEWHPSSFSWVLVAISWTLVGIPLAWGIWKTLQKASVLFE